MQRLLFEIIPPPVGWRDKKIRNWAERLVDFLNRHSLKFLNIPEVIPQKTRKYDRFPYTEKLPATRLIKVFRTLDPSLKLVLNRVVPIVSKRKFEEWVKDMVEDWNIRHFVLVGGESSQINHPGYSVIESAEWVKENYPDVYIGGITIFTRKQETQRIYSKLTSGIDFFVSQIVFDIDNMKKILHSLQDLLTSKKMKPPRFYISLAPIFDTRDIDFLEQFGVGFPSDTNREELSINHYDILKKILEEIERFSIERDLDLGVNFGHIMYKNIELSFDLFDRLKEEFSLFTGGTGCKGTP